MRLHKDHGLNPTLSICILCKKETGEIALLGAKYKEKAPMQMITSVKPCKDCQEKYLKDGVLLIKSKEDKIPMGDMVVIKQEEFNKIFNIPIPEEHICFVEPTAFDKLFKGE